MALPRALLVLLFLNLSLLGGHAAPTGSPDGNSGPSGELELLDHAPKSVSGLQEEQMTLDLRQEVSGPTQVEEPGEPAAPKVLRKAQKKRKHKPDSCFGHKLDRIGTWSGLGCNKPKSS